MNAPLDVATLSEWITAGGRSIMFTTKVQVARTVEAACNVSHIPYLSYLNALPGGKALEVFNDSPPDKPFALILHGIDAAYGWRSYAHRIIWCGPGVCEGAPQWETYQQCMRLVPVEWAYASDDADRYVKGRDLIKPTRWTTVRTQHLQLLCE